MPISSEQGLFQVLEQELRKAKEPLDCNDLFDKPSVREYAATANRVSDYLGNLWRKGLVLRVPAPRLEGTKARWMYVWKDKGPKKRSRPDLSQAVAFDPVVDNLLHKPGIDVSEDGKTVTITTQFAVITIQQREQAE